MKSFFKATTRGNTVGDGSVKAMTDWLEKYVRILFPENGIEYFTDSRHRNGRGLTGEMQMPITGTQPECVHHIACYVREGSCEGRVIEAAAVLRNGDLKSITWAKTFGSDDESWEIARAIDAALTSIIFWNETPELVAMGDRIPKQYPWSSSTNLQEGVTVLSGPDWVQVLTEAGVVLDDRCWEASARSSGACPTAVTEDWATVLKSTKAPFAVIECTRGVELPDLPGYAMVRQCVAESGFVVLPPGGHIDDESTWVGRHPDLRSATEAARNHQRSQVVSVTGQGMTLKLPKLALRPIEAFLLKMSHLSDGYALHPGVTFKCLHVRLMQEMQIRAFENSDELAWIALARDVIEKAIFVPKAA